MAVCVGFLFACIPTHAQETERRPIMGMISSLFGGVKDSFMDSRSAMTKEEADVGERGLFEETSRDKVDNAETDLLNSSEGKDIVRGDEVRSPCLSKSFCKYHRSHLDRFVLFTLRERRT